MDARDLERDLRRLEDFLAREARHPDDPTSGLKVAGTQVKILRLRLAAGLYGALRSERPELEPSRN